jgi:hypothetical protein
MKVESTGLPIQSRLLSAVGSVITLLAILGAVSTLFGTPPSESRPASVIDEAPRVMMQDRAATVAVRYEPTWEKGPALAVAQPWPFESAAATVGGAQGKKRADLLSAPDGWIYEASAGTAGGE